MPLVAGSPGVWLQTLLLKHNCRVKQRQQKLIAAGAPEVPVNTELLLWCVVCVKLSSVGEFGETGE